MVTQKGNQAASSAEEKEWQDLGIDQYDQQRLRSA